MSLKTLPYLYIKHKRYSYESQFLLACNLVLILFHLAADILQVQSDALIMTTTIEQLLFQVEKTYQEQDASALARLHHPNARYAKLSGGYAVGRDEIQDYLPEVFEASPKHVQSETILRDIEKITPDLAIIDTRIRHLHKEDQTSLGIEGFTTVAIREEGEWLVAAVRGALVSKQN